MKKSQLRNIIRESVKGLMNEQTGLTCYTCINGTIYSTNAFTSTTGPYTGGGDAGVGINICGQVPLATGISYTSFTGTFNIGTTVGNDLVFFDNPSTPYFTALGCKLPSRPDPVDPCDKANFINYITTNYPQFASPAGYEIAHFCEKCNENQGPGPSPISGFDPMCKCCKKKPKPTPKSKALREVKNPQLRHIIRESIKGLMNEQGYNNNCCELSLRECGAPGNTANMLTSQFDQYNGTCPQPGDIVKVNNKDMFVMVSDIFIWSGPQSIYASCPSPNGTFTPISNSTPCPFCCYQWPYPMPSGMAPIGACAQAGGCSSQILGCTDSTANNFDPNATQDDGSCDYGWRCKEHWKQMAGLPGKCVPGTAQNPGPFPTKQDCLSSGCEPLPADQDLEKDITPFTTTPQSKIVGGGDGCVDDGDCEEDAVCRDGFCEQGEKNISQPDDEIQRMQKLANIPIKKQ